jgi:hypothetical protein
MIYLTAIGQLFSTHVHTNSTGNVRKQTIPRPQNIHRTTQQLGRVWAVPRLCGFYPGLCLTTEEKARKNLKHEKNLKGLNKRSKYALKEFMLTQFMDKAKRLNSKRR